MKNIHRNNKFEYIKKKILATVNTNKIFTSLYREIFTAHAQAHAYSRTTHALTRHVHIRTCVFTVTQILKYKYINILKDYYIYLYVNLFILHFLLLF